MSERSYLRFYYPEFIRDYPDVYASDALLATWLRLLATAEAMWPASPELPRSVRGKPLSVLVDRGLVTVDGITYRMKGLDAERTRRSASGRNAAAVRWHSERIADPMPKRDETRRDETSNAREVPDDDGRADLEAFLLVTRRAPTPRQRQLLDKLLDVHDVTGPQWAADIILRNPTDPIGAVIAADKAWREARIEEAKVAETPKPKPRRSHGLPQSARDILAELQRIDAEGTT